MKLSVDRKALAGALAAAVRIVSRRTTIPILSNVLVAAADGALTVTANNLDMTIAASVPAEVERAGAATLPAHILNDIARSLPAEARVALDAPEGERAVIRSGRSRSTLATLPAGDFPETGREDFAHRFDLPGGAFARALERCLVAASTEENRYYLNGVLLHAHDAGDDGPALRLVATDGHRLVLTALPLPDAAAGVPWTIVPRLAAAEIVRLASGAGETPMGVALGTRLMRVALPGGIALTTKLVDGSFPDYARVMPAGNTKTARLDRLPLKEAIERVRHVRDAGATGGVPAKFAFAGDKLTISVTAELNEAVEEVDAATEDRVETGYNTRYVLDLLDALDGDAVVFRLEDPGSPALITAEADRRTTCVLMPLRV